MKKIDGEFIEKNNAPNIQGFFPHSLLVEKGKANEEIIGAVKLFLLPKIQFLYRVKVLSKSKKSLFEKNVLLVKYNLKILMGVRIEKEAAEIYHMDKDFILHCIRVVSCYMFSAFYGQNKRVISNIMLETLNEEDETLWETSKLK